MKRFTIGAGITCDLDRLVNTRLLVQANSGAGKSWALRRLLEQTHGHIQQIVIDPEGEFASLREKFDYVLAARQGGDTLADARTAKLLAERLLELGVSAILDIYELKPHERIAFVKTFLDALVEAPKQLWHPALVLLDEAHVYAPEKGHGEAESADAVKSLATRGRKRGFCLIPATQRLSKLHKDVAAECNNKLIGRSSLDVDMKRAANELGFTTKEQLLSLRDLADGEFYAFGPALAKAVTKVKVGPVQTTHPKAGSKLAAVVPPPTDKVKALLPKLSDLPAEAEARERTVKDLRQEITTLKRDLTLARKATPVAPPPPKADTAKAERIVELKQQLARQQRAMSEAMKILVKVKAIDFSVETDEDRKALEQAVAAAVRQVTGPIEKRVTALASRVEGIKSEAGKAQAAIAALLDEKIDLTVQVARREPFAVAAERPHVPRRQAPDATTSVAGDLGGPEKKILASLAELEALGLHPADKQQLGLMAGYTNVRSGGFSEPLGRLVGAGYVSSPMSGKVAITDAGRALVGSIAPPASTAEMQDRVMEKLTGPERKLLTALIDDYPRPLTKQALGERCGYTNIRSGGFSEPLGRLTTLGLVATPSRGEVAASAALFLEDR